MIDSVEGLAEINQQLTQIEATFIRQWAFTALSSLKWRRLFYWRASLQQLYFYLMELRHTHHYFQCLRTVKCQNKMVASMQELHYAMTSEELEDMQ